MGFLHFSKGEKMNIRIDLTKIQKVQLKNIAYVIHDVQKDATTENLNELKYLLNQFLEEPLIQALTGEID